MRLMWFEHMTAQAIGPGLVQITTQATEAKAEARSRGGETLVAVHNITAARLSFRLSGLGGDLNQPWADCLSGHVFEPHQSHSLEPYAVHWLVQP